MRTIGNLIQTPTDDLTERISVRYFETERNQYGDIVKITEKERCRIWAKILPLSAKSLETTPEKANKITYRVIIRYRADIKPDDEILWRGRRLKITMPPYDAESRKIFTVFESEEVVSYGSP